MAVAGPKSSTTSAVLPQAPTSTATSVLQAATTTADAVAQTLLPDASVTIPETGNADALIHAAFASTASALYPVPTYAPTALPPGARLTVSWRPVLSAEEQHPPAQSETPDPPVGNPRLSLEGSESQAEILVDVPNGALLFLENFRGDLGDVTGEPVGDVAGHHASRYDLAGGTLVQWSDEGRWYAVYGRGEGAQHVVAVAKGMRVLRPS